MKKIVSLLSIVLFVAATWAEVDLEWRLENEGVRVGDTVRVRLYAVAENPGENDPFCAMQVIVQWDEGYLTLIGNDDNGPQDWMLSGFPDDSGLDGLNDSFEDGDAYYHLWCNWFEPGIATPEGLLLTTFEFEALAPTDVAGILIAETFGGCSVTAVLDEEIPGLNIVGELGAIEVTIAPRLLESNDHHKDTCR